MLCMTVMNHVNACPCPRTIRTIRPVVDQPDGSGLLGLPARLVTLGPLARGARGSNGSSLMTPRSRGHPLRRHARAHQMPPVFFVVVERTSGFLERFEIATARALAAEKRLKNRPSGQQMIADHPIDHDSDPAAVGHLEHEVLRR